nr:hypothetical protein [Tanacetum cinerariifolium]
IKLLINFIWKFIGTVRFRNDHVAAILGFGDLQWGNILITRIYFVKGLGHNLFSFKYHKEHLCPSCEQEKSKRASHPPKPVPNSRQRLHLLHMDLCGPMRIASINGKCALCYPKNNREDIGKLGAKGDIGFFIGYSADSCELDLLFEAMYDDYIGGQPSATARTVLPAQEPQMLDYAGCKDTFKSTSGGAQFLGEKLLTDYGFHFNKIPIYCDSKSAIAISCNPIQHSRTKHIAVRYHFIKEHMEKGSIELCFVKTDYQLADIFTKALLADHFNYLVRRLGMRSLSPKELERLEKSQ